MIRKVVSFFTATKNDVDWKVVTLFSFAWSNGMRWEVKEKCLKTSAQKKEPYSRLKYSIAVELKHCLHNLVVWCCYDAGSNEAAYVWYWLHFAESVWQDLVQVNDIPLPRWLEGDWLIYTSVDLSRKKSSKLRCKAMMYFYRLQPLSGRACAFNYLPLLILGVSVQPTRSWTSLTVVVTIVISPLLALMVSLNAPP